MKKIRTKKNYILVIGLGRVGLPQALNLSMSGHTVYGLDRSSITIEALKSNQTPFYEPKLDMYLKNSLNKTFFPCSSLKEISQPSELDTVIFSVGTRPPTMEEVISNHPLLLEDYYSLIDQLHHFKILKNKIKVIIRTTMPLGGTDTIKAYIEKKHSLSEGKDFLLAFVPERIIEGKAIEEFRTIPVIIGAYSETAFKMISPIFQYGHNKIIRVKNPVTAEFCKLTDNSFRDTIFSYANEIAMHANNFDIDVTEVIHTVNDHYARNKIPLPGFVSGYCLSKDPNIFEMGFLKSMKDRDFHSVWYYGRKTNDYLIDYTVDKVMTHLQHSTKKHVTILGLSFNADVDDFRMSHSFKIIEKIINKGIDKINVYDPNLEKNKYTTIPEHFDNKIVFKSQELEQKLFKEVDAIIICDRHRSLIKANRAILLKNLLRSTVKPCYIFDGWNIWKESSAVKHIIYESLGYRGNGYQ